MVITLWGEKFCLFNSTGVELRASSLLMTCPQPVKLGLKKNLQFENTDVNGNLN
jgi:hypothetical protein